jgi:AraC-like DNA-binding protein
VDHGPTKPLDAPGDDPRRAPLSHFAREFRAAYGETPHGLSIVNSNQATNASSGISRQPNVQAGCLRLRQ